MRLRRERVARIPMIWPGIAAVGAGRGLVAGRNGGGQVLGATKRRDFGAKMISRLKPGRPRSSCGAGS